MKQSIDTNKYKSIFFLLLLISCSNEPTVKQYQNKHYDKHSSIIDSIPTLNLPPIPNEGIESLKLKSLYFYKLKQYYAMHYNQRDKLTVADDLFISKEVKDILVQKFLIPYNSSGWPLMVNLNDVYPITKELTILKDGTVVLPIAENPNALYLGDSLDMSKISRKNVISLYNSKKYFFLYKKIKNKYLLSDIALLNVEKLDTTKYSSKFVKGIVASSNKK